MRKPGMCIKLVAMVLTFSLVMPMQAIPAATGGEAVAVAIDHQPPQDKYIPGFRIQLDTTISSGEGFIATRCYFKAKKDPVFTFVNMRNIQGNEYRAILPAPWVNSEYIEYLFVTVNKAKLVTRTQMYKIEEAEIQEAAEWKEVGEVKEIRIDQAQEVVEQNETFRAKIREKYSTRRPAYQLDSQGVLVVSTELDKPLSLSGFYDGIKVFRVPPADCFGFLADQVYTVEQISDAGGLAAVSSATDATSGGTLAVPAAGLSTGTIIGIGVGVAALVGGAVALGGSSGDSDDDSAGPVNVAAATAANFVGTYANKDPDRSTSQWRGITTLGAGGGGSWEEWISGAHHSGNLNWSWNQSTHRMTINYLTGAVFSGTVSGTTYNFTLSGHWGGGSPGTIIFNRQ